MRLLVTGGSGFLGGYVLDEARRRGHEIVALARSDKAAAAVASHGAEPLTGDFDDPAGLPRVFSSARCSSLLNIASLGFGHAPAILASVNPPSCAMVRESRKMSPPVWALSSAAQAVLPLRLT